MIRRTMMKRLGVFPFFALGSLPSLSQTPDEEREKAAWMSEFSIPNDGWRTRPAKVRGGGAGSSGPFRLIKFPDNYWVTTEPVEYEPDKPETIGRHPRVTVPGGFVTDFASVPRILWTYFPRDGRYARAAVIHDWLYWIQSYSRQIADDIFRYAMMDDRVPDRTRQALYAAVATAGQLAWNQNARTRAAGISHVLAKFPSDPLTTWNEWRRIPGVFSNVDLAPVQK